MWSRFVAISKNIGFIAGAVVACGSIYAFAGLPLPVSEATVNAKIDARVIPMMRVLTSVERSQMTIIGDLTVLQRNTLRNERMALESALPGATTANKVIYNLRIGQIADELTKLDHRDQEAAKVLEIR